MSKTNYGSQPINEQSGTKESWAVIISKIIKSIEVPNVDKDPEGSIKGMKTLNDINDLIKIIINLESNYHRILTAAKVSTVDEVVQMLDRHPLSPEDIERAAKDYVIDNVFDSSHIADAKSFIAGANFAKQPIANEWVKDLLRWLKDNHFLNETEDTLNYIVNNYNPPKK